MIDATKKLLTESIPVNTQSQLFTHNNDDARTSTHCLSIHVLDGVLDENGNEYLNDDEMNDPQFPP